MLIECLGDIEKLVMQKLVTKDFDPNKLSSS